MRGLMIANAVGAVAAVACAGFLLGRGLAPFGSAAAAAVFLFGVFRPFAHERRALQRGFESAEAEFRTALDRDWFPDGRPETLSDEPPRDDWRSRPMPSAPMLIAALLGLALMAVDFARLGAGV